MSEFWLSYHFSSRAHLEPTIQLIELDHLETKLSDLEDVLDYLFKQDFINAKYRPATWWEKKCGQKIKSSTTINSLLEIGVGKTPESAVKLFIEDLPNALWFRYIYLHKTPTEVVTQRIKYPGLNNHSEKLAHVTNHVFAHGYLPCKYRGVVHWECPAGKHLIECALVDEILAAGNGVSEDKPLRLVIDNKSVHGCHSYHYDHSHHSDHYGHHISKHDCTDHCDHYVPKHGCSDHSDHYDHHIPKHGCSDHYDHYDHHILKHGCSDHYDHYEHHIPKHGCSCAK